MPKASNEANLLLNLLLRFILRAGVASIQEWPLFKKYFIMTNFFGLYSSAASDRERLLMARYSTLNLQNFISDSGM